MKKILVVIGTYLPGYKAGGPVLSIANLIEYLGTEYEFHVLTSCCDLGEITPYEGITVDRWTPVGHALVYYTSDISMEIVERLSEGMDVVYVCGCFNAYARNVLRLYQQGKIHGRVIIASMGLFSDGAFRIKYWKKKTYMVLSNLLGWYRGIEWSASTEEEAVNIGKHVWGKISYHIAKDLPRTVSLRSVSKLKQKGCLDIVFLSRISRKKNLSYAIAVLKKITDVSVHFSIVGTMEDEAYWEECRILLHQLPRNITWEYKGGISSAQVVKELEQHQVFLFPTLGENYGHVIQEALSAGCVALISDQTPWQDLEQAGVGAAIPLSQPDKYVEWMKRFADMDEAQFQNLSDQAIRYAYDNSNIDEMADRYREMFKGTVLLP